LRRLAILLTSCAAVVFAAETKEAPVGLITSAGGAKLLRAGTETALDARAGDLLFSGDGVRTGTGPASFLYCPAKSLQTLGPSGEVLLDVKTAKVKSGKITDQKPVQSCFLPSSVRLAVASQQHYGVSMTRGVDTPEVPPVPASKLPADVAQLLIPVDQTLAADPKDAAALTARAAIFETHNLPSNALVEYQKLRAVLPDAIWIQGKIFELQQAVAAAQQTASATPAAGNTYAVLVGVSKYKNPELSLQFAERDASVFDKLLLSPRGGGLPPDNVLLLTDEKATTAALRNAFQNFLKRRATKADTVVLMIAGHGTVELPGSKKGYILTYDSDPQDLNSTALPMAELQSLFEEQVSKVGRVILYVDVCKSGTIGSIKNTNINGEVQHLGEVDGDLFGLMASRPRELSLEAPQFGGGHGLFSYFVLKGLSGEADTNKDGKVDASELIKYVTDHVSATSDNKQHPREFGTYDNSMTLSDDTKPGIEIAGFPILYDSRSGQPLYFASSAPQNDSGTPQADRAITDFQSAVRAGRVLPDASANAFSALDRLKPLLNRERYLEQENLLRVALEDRAQEVLLRYLIGDEVPQTSADFSDGAKFMEAARRLTPESLYLEGREDFFQGRALLFQKKWTDAARLLESAVRIDPTAGYAYNALGIAYLEQAMYDKAVPAFRDAARHAQHWSYPLHNLALAYMESGNYQGSIRAYQDAMRLTPQYGYLPYNLGFVYQRIGKRKEAEASYRQALHLEPDSAEAYNALGVLEASQGKFAEAERNYRTALQKDPKFLAARHNLSVLLAGRPDRAAEALALWRENLAQDPEYISSRLSLARALEASNQSASAKQEYQTILRSKPDYAAARIALANLLAKGGDSAAAISELQEVLKGGAGNLEVFEQLGDLQKAAGRADDARSSYESALKFANDSASRSRIRKKLKF
jgi:tetratricopeptide (TPR) repeat protein